MTDVPAPTPVSPVPAFHFPSRLLGIVELTNLRLFKETPAIDVPFRRPATDEGQWIVLVGENGVG